MKPWTIMLYIAGDNNLDIAGFRNIKDMEKVGSTSILNLVVQYDRCKQFYTSENRWEGTRRYFITKSDNPDSITSHEVGPNLGETDTGDPKALVDFATWTIQNYPAENYMLIIGGHGTGWKDWPDYKAAPSFRRSIFNHPKLFAQRKSEGLLSLSHSPIARAIANDDDAKDFLDNQKLAKALEQITGVIPNGQNSFMVGFDACLMNMIEVLYENRKSSRFFIGSEEAEPGEGWPYSTILSRFLSSQPPSVVELSEIIAGGIIKYFDGQTRNNEQIPVTQSVLDTKFVQDLAMSVNVMAQLCVDHFDKELYINLLGILKRRVQHFYDRSYIDLSHFASLLGDSLTIPQLKEACNSVVTNVHKAVIYNGHLSENDSNSYGISIYFPFADLGEGFESIYKTLYFCQDWPQWARLLEKYHNYEL
jgi:hypothetical protein